MSRMVAYERVSTARQGASGLGIDAQRLAMEAYAGQRGATILARFTEVESGRKAAGAYLDQLGRTDMAQLSRVEWAEFCERLTRGYLEELQSQADAQVPF